MRGGRGGMTDWIWQVSEKEEEKRIKKNFSGNKFVEFV